MAKLDTSSDIAPSQLLLDAAEEHYAGALEDMLGLRKDLRARGDVTETEMRRVTGNYTRATQTLFDERKKLEEFNKRKGGTAADHIIDFAAIRGEIGGLLDRLRPYSGPSGVSEQSE